MKIYCPYCQHDIEPINFDEVESGEHTGYIYTHDEGVDHPEDYFLSTEIH